MIRDEKCGWFLGTEDTLSFWGTEGSLGTRGGRDIFHINDRIIFLVFIIDLIFLSFIIGLNLYIFLVFIIGLYLDIFSIIIIIHLNVKIPFNLKRFVVDYV